MLHNNSVEELEEVLLEERTDIGTKSELIVYNDDFNTFDWVIQSFMEVFKYSSEQSEQLAMLIHFGGKATVKTASREVLRPFKDALTDRGLSAVIEELQKG
ncbi:MAG: ATP-dependent Clp protease adaptor ClpS [Bacteroidota bacterium]